MSGFAANISRQVHRDTGHYLIYPPGVSLALGDIVERSSGIWVPVGNLARELDIDIAVAPDGPSGSWEPSSERGFSMDVKLKGDPTSPPFKYLADAEAGVRVALSGDNAFVLSLKDVHFERIDSIDRFWQAVKQRRGFWTWDRSRRIVTRLVRAGSATFLASGSGGTSFELTAKADLQIGTLSIADLAAGFSLKSTMSARDRFVAETGATPLFGAHKVKLVGGLGLTDFGRATLDDTELEEETGEDDESR